MVVYECLGLHFFETVPSQDGIEYLLIIAGVHLNGKQSCSPFCIHSTKELPFTDLTGFCHLSKNVSACLLLKQYLPGKNGIGVKKNAYAMSQLNIQNYQIWRGVQKAASKLDQLS